MRINEADAVTRLKIGVKLIQEERRLTHARLANDVEMPPTIFLADADDATVFTKTNLADNDRPILSS